MKNFILAVFFLFSISAIAQELTLVTAEIPPYSMVENGVQTGVTVDVVKEMARRVGQSDEFQFLPWQEPKIKPHKTMPTVSHHYPEPRTEKTNILGCPHTRNQ